MRLAVTLVTFVVFHPPRSTSSRSLRALICEGDSLMRSVVSFMALKERRRKERERKLERKQRYVHKDVSTCTAISGAQIRQTLYSWMNPSSTRETS